MRTCASPTALAADIRLSDEEVEALDRAVSAEAVIGGRYAEPEMELLGR